MSLDGQPINGRAWVKIQNDMWDKGDDVGATLAQIMGDANRYNARNPAQVKKLYREFNEGAPLSRPLSVSPEIWDEAWKQFKSRVNMAPDRGRMYEVNLHADPNKFLDWDKPLSGQGADVQKGIAGTYGNFTTMLPESVTQGKNGRWYTMRGEDVVGKFDGWPDKGTATDALKIMREDAIPNYTVGDWYKKMNSPEFQSEKLRDAGIPGIKYLDAGSRGAGDGTRNFVVFDPKIIEIVRKYGLGALGLTGLLGAQEGEQGQ